MNHKEIEELLYLITGGDDSKIIADDYVRLKKEWKELRKDKDKFPFYEYTDFLLNELKNEQKLLLQGRGYISEIRNVQA